MVNTQASRALKMLSHSLSLHPYESLFLLLFFLGHSTTVPSPVVLYSFQDRADMEKLKKYQKLKKAFIQARNALCTERVA